MPDAPANLSDPGADLRALSIVILVYNRRDALRRTLREVEHHARAGAEVIVIDNASADDSFAVAREAAPWARVEHLDRNLGVEGFNRGAALASRDVLLILDDDAWPEPEALRSAIALFATRPELAGVMLHRRHPATGELEWPFGRVSGAREPWPDMGCANLVRRSAWQAVGGYESAFFLYRNDTDLALKLLGAGGAVHFHPGWIALHDSPAARTKSLRWFFLSTRNWVWMCRRHARGFTRWEGIVLGWAWAHRLAGWRPRAHARAFAGAWAGLFRPAPRLPASVTRRGPALRQLLRLKRRLRARGSPRPDGLRTAGQE